MCYLKREVVPRTQSDCCVSGVRGAGVIEPQAGAIEYSIDRYGGDYRSFETRPIRTARPAPTPARPSSAAAPGPIAGRVTASPLAHCYLKETIKPPRHRPCCISGVVR